MIQQIKGRALCLPFLKETFIHAGCRWKRPANFPVKNIFSQLHRETVSELTYFSNHSFNMRLFLWSNTYCSICFHDFEPHSEVHLSIMSSRQCCVLLLTLLDSSWTSCKGNNELMLTLLHFQPSWPGHKYFCWYLFRRACCKWTVSSCEDVSDFIIIGCVWKSDETKNIISSLLWQNLIHLL